MAEPGFFEVEAIDPSTKQPIILEFPEGTPDDVVRGAMRKAIGIQDQPQPQPVSDIPPAPPSVAPEGLPGLNASALGVTPRETLAELTPFDSLRGHPSVPKLLREPDSGQLIFEPGLMPEDIEARQADPTVGGDFDIARTVMSGLRDAAAGLSSFPFDIASALGLGGGETAESIRESLPQIPTRTTGEAVGSAVTQFGAPGGAGARLAQKGAQLLPQIPKVGGIITNAIAPLLGATAADTAAADPDQASTLGDLFNAGPTNIQPDDSPLTKRAKVGAETLVAGPVMGATVGPIVRGVDKGVQGVRKLIEPLSQGGRESRVARTLQEVATDKGDAVKGIEKTQQQFKDTPEFEPTSGIASGDPGLIQLERGLASEPDIVTRTVETRDLAAKQVEQATEPSTVRGDKTKAEFESQATAARESAEGELKAAQEASDDALTRMQTNTREIESLQRGKGDASAKIDAAVREVEESLTKQKNDLFAAVDPEGTLKKDASDLVEAARAIKKEPGQGDDAIPSTLLGDIKRLAKGGDEAAEAGEEGAEAVAKSADGVAEEGTGEVSFRFLVNMRQRISDEIGAARAANNGARVNNLLRLKGTVQDEISSFASEGGSEAAKRLDDALTFFANEFAPRFKQGAGGQFRNVLKKSAPGTAPPTGTADRFLKQGSGSREPAEDLKRIIEKAENPADAEKAVRDYLVGDLADTIVSGGKLNVDRLKTWRGKRREVLNQFPEIRRDVQQLESALGGASKRTSELEAQVKAAAAGVKRTEDELKRSATRLFLDRDPVDAVKSAMGGTTDPAGTMKELVRAAKQDATGEALEGLKSSVKLWARDQLTTAARTLSDTPAASMARLEKFFRNEARMKAMREVFTPQELGWMNKAREELQLLARRDTVKSTSGSPTSDLNIKADQVRIVLASMYGIVRGRGVFQLGKWMSDAMGVNPKAAARELLLDSMLDPELAKTLLMKETKQFETVIRGRLKTYITNNALGALSEDSE